MACGVVGDTLMLRLGEQGAGAALDEPHVRAMDFTGKPMRTMVFIDSAGTVADGPLAAWIGRAVGSAQCRSAREQQSRVRRAG